MQTHPLPFHGCVWPLQGTMQIDANSSWCQIDVQTIIFGVSRYETIHIIVDLYYLSTLIVSMVTLGSYSSNHLVADRPSRPSSPNFEMVEPGAYPMDAQGCGGAIKRKQGTNSCSLGGEKSYPPMPNHLQAVVLGENWILMIECWMKLNHIIIILWSTTVLLWVGKAELYPQINHAWNITQQIFWALWVLSWGPSFQAPWWVPSFVPICFFLQKHQVGVDGYMRIAKYVEIIDFLYDKSKIMRMFQGFCNSFWGSDFF